MSIPKLKFFALFFVFFAVFWQITTSFYIKMLSAGRQDFPRAAGGVRLSPQKPSAFHASVRSGPLRRAFFGRRQNCRAFQKTVPRCARDKEETGTILSLAWQKRRFARSGLGSEACKPARLRRPAQVCLSDCAQNRVAFGSNTTPACRQDGITCAACIDGIVIILAARFCAVAIWRGHLLPLRRTSAPLLPRRRCAI